VKVVWEAGEPLGSSDAKRTLRTFGEEAAKEDEGTEPGRAVSKSNGCKRNFGVRVRRFNAWRDR